MARHVSSGYTQTFYQAVGPPGESKSEGVGWKNDGYVQQTSELYGNRLHVVSGLRVDTAALFDAHPVSPQVSAAWQLTPGTQFQAGYGRYHQFDFPAYPLSFFAEGCTVTQESLDAANHYEAGLEHRFAQSARVQLLLFGRSDDLMSSQIASAGCFPLFTSQGFRPLERDYSRGAQVVLQSRNANRLSGWISYTLAYARQSDYQFATVQNGMAYWLPYAPTLADQRNTVNVFGNYRLTPTLNVGGKFLFGSGYPLPMVTTSTLRLGDYQRLDLRAEKDWSFRKKKLALYGELLNATNHDNPRYFYTNNAGNVVTGQGLPWTPTAGAALEF